MNALWIVAVTFIIILVIAIIFYYNYPSNNSGSNRNKPPNGNNERKEIMKQNIIQEIKRNPVPPAQEKVIDLGDSSRFVSSARTGDSLPFEVKSIESNNEQQRQRVLEALTKELSSESESLEKVSEKTGNREYSSGKKKR